MDILETLKSSARNHRVQLLATGLVSGGASAYATYLVVSKKAEAKYAAIADEEIREAKLRYSVINKPTMPTAEVVVEEEQAPVELTPQTIIQDAPEETRRVFRDYSKAANNVDSPVEHAEVFAHRDTSRPYVLTNDEFMSNEREDEGYTQVCLTYFQGDDVLVDEEDNVIEDNDLVVGDDNLVKFGSGSKDQNVVYVRNEAKQLEFEIIRSEGKYAHEVLGFDMEETELRHSHRSGGRKFRSNDD